MACSQPGFNDAMYATGVAEQLARLIAVDEFALAESYRQACALRPRRETAAANLPGFLRWGAGEPRLALLHGSVQTAHIWDPLLCDLDQPALAIDLPGHGRSPWRADRDYRPVRLAEDVVAVLRAEVRAPLVLVGASLGGLVSIAIQAMAPELVVGLILVDVVPGPITPLSEVRAARMVERYGERCSFDSIEALIGPNLAALEVGERRRLIAMLHNIHVDEEGWWRWRHDPALFDGVRAGRDWSSPDLWSGLGDCAVPVLLVRGEDSHFISEAARARFVSDVPHGRTVSIEGAGHDVAGDQPARLLALIRQFLRDHG